MTKRDALKELATVRDEVRLQAHLFSMDARERWSELERELDAIERKLEQGEDSVSDVATGAMRRVMQSVRDLLRSHPRQEGRTGLDARAIMTEPVRTCAPDDSLNAAAQILWECNCGAVPVVDADGKLLGMITDRDICMAAYTRGIPLSGTTVGSAMSKHVISCTPEDSVSRVLEIMGDHQVRRLPVVTAGRRVVGIVALADVARMIRFLRQEQPDVCGALAETLAKISEPPREQPADGESKKPSS